MRLFPLLLLCACGSTVATAPPAEGTEAPERATVEPVAEPVLDGIRFRPVLHATLEISTPAGVIWLDPTTRGPLGDPHNADIVLITDVHGDHLDSAGVDAVMKAGTRVVGPAAVSEQLASSTDVLANGESLTIGAVQITAVPMYNNHRGPEDGVLFHPKGRGNGYIIEVGSERIYVAGDTACTDEMKALTGITTAFIPMNLPYTMTPEEAAECVAAFSPNIAIPYHYRGADNVMSDRSVFADALADTTVIVAMSDFYPSE